MKIHIGRIIEDQVRIKGIPIVEFAKQIKRSRRGVYDLFSTPSIDTDLLMRVSEVLGKNMFVYYITDEDWAKHQIELNEENEFLKLTDSLFRFIQEEVRRREQSKGKPKKQSSKK